MNNNNSIVTYKALNNPLLTATATATKLIDLIEAANPSFNKSLESWPFSLNTVRINVKTGTLGIRVDGGRATQDANLAIAAESHFIENSDISKMSLIGVGGDATFVVQIGGF